MFGIADANFSYFAKIILLFTYNTTNKVYGNLIILLLFQYYAMLVYISTGSSFVVLYKFLACDANHGGSKVLNDKVYTFSDLIG